MNLIQLEKVASIEEITIVSKDLKKVIETKKASWEILRQYQENEVLMVKPISCISEPSKIDGSRTLSLGIKVFIVNKEL